LITLHSAYKTSAEIKTESLIYVVIIVGPFTYIFLASLISNLF